MRHRGLEIVATRTPAAHVIAVSGEIDLDSVDAVVAAVADLPTDSEAVELDLVEVSFIDSAGIAGLNRCRRQAVEAERSLSVRCRRGGPVARLLEWTGLSGLLDVRLVESASSESRQL